MQKSKAVNHMVCQTEFFTVSDKKTLRKSMISRHLYSTGQRFKQLLYEKDFKTRKRTREEASANISN